ncbi:hypothetical protein MNBD_ACTINO01-214, partial [hydrothermal vent metagenome]
KYQVPSTKYPPSMDVSSLNPRSRIAESASSLFSHASYPLEHSLDYPRDPGLFGPDSVTWQVVGDAAAFIGGIRALLIQAAHPEVVAGVVEHSTYETDPLGRLSRTSAYVAATSYGAMPEVEAVLEVVNRAHTGIVGTSHRGRSYSANSPRYAAWVHNALADSFLTAYESFGPRPLDPPDHDRYVQEQARLGARFQTEDLPTTRNDLAAWIADHPDIGPSPGMEQVVAFLADPPLPRSASGPYAVLFQAAITTIPDRIATILGVRRRLGAHPCGSVLTRTLRWALGASPSWWLALERTATPLPKGVAFRRPPPIVGVEQRFAASLRGR